MPESQRTPRQISITNFPFRMPAPEGRTADRLSVKLASVPDRAYETPTMLLDEIKSQMFKAMKEGRIVEKEILRVAVGEITTQAARDGGTGGDEQAQAIVRKLIKSNQESLALCPNEQKAALELEIQTLSALLPKSLDCDEIIAQLAPVREGILAAANVGQATGVAMKHLKTLGATVSGKDVALAVTKIRE